MLYEVITPQPQVHGPRQLPAHAAGQIWLPTRLHDQAKDGAGFPDLRPGTGASAWREDGRQPCGPGSGTRQRQFQHPDRQRCGARDFPPSLPVAATQRRLWLRSATKDSNLTRRSGNIV